MSSIFLLPELFFLFLTMICDNCCCYVFGFSFGYFYLFIRFYFLAYALLCLLIHLLSILHSYNLVALQKIQMTAFQPWMAETTSKNLKLLDHMSKIRHVCITLFLFLLCCLVFCVIPLLINGKKKRLEGLYFVIF